MAFGGLIAQSRRIGLLDRRLRRFTQGQSGRSLEGVLEGQLEQVQRLTGDVETLMARATVLEADSRRAFSRIGLVRFNPFEDTGGNQSFALALLDSREDGIVVSGLHTRAATRVYAKAISGGRPEAPLSDEEQTAVEQASGEGLGRRELADRVAGERGATER
jgi:hypothetical protein